jgi:WD40 repeat protein
LFFFALGVLDHPYLWEIGKPGNTQLAIGSHDGTVFGLAFSRDGRRLASASDDQTVKVWDWQNLVRGQRAGKTPPTKWMLSGVVLTLRGHTHFVTSVAFGPDGQWLVSGSDDGTAKDWDAVHSRESTVLPVEGYMPRDLAISPDGRFLACPVSDRDEQGKATSVVTVWDLQRGKPFRSVEGISGFANSAALTRDGKVLAVGKDDHTVSVWSLTTGAKVVLGEHTGPVRRVRFSPDGRRLATASGGGGFTANESREKPGEILLWDATNWKKKPRVLRGHTQGIMGVAFSPDGRWLASCSHDRTIRIWRVATGKLLHVLRGHQGEVAGVDFSPDGKHLASVAWDKTVVIWDVTAGRGAPTKSRTLRGDNSPALCLVYSPDGQRVVTTYGRLNDSEIKVWDTGTGRHLLTLRGFRGSAWGAAFGADGRRLYTAMTPAELRIWDGTPLQDRRTGDR